MSFVGLVTQKEKPTGVSLMAKIVTENKKKSAKKIFKVSVKANALDDFTCCVIDHGTAVDKINTSQDMSQITDDVNLSYSGIHGTTISYRIIDVDVPYLSSYLGEDGKVHGRPRYGENNATGYIEITVTKGEASVVSRIQASVKQYTEEEVLNDGVFTQAAMWTLIKGQNTESYQYGSEWSGHNNILGKLNLITSQEVNTMSIEPVSISWSVNDSTLAYASEIYTEPRINPETGVVTRPTYKDACSLVDTVPGINIKVIGSNLNGLQNRVRIGGITLTGTLSLGSKTRDIVFNCSTISKYLTSQEVMDVVLANIYINTQQNAKILYKDVSDSSFFTITAPTSGGAYTLRAFGSEGSETFEAPELRLNVGDITGVVITNTVLDFDGSNEYPDPALLSSAFSGGFQNDEGNIYSKLVIDLDALKDVSEDKKEFACGATISISGYSATGDTLGGSPLIIKRHAQIKVDTSTIVTS